MSLVRFDIDTELEDLRREASQAFTTIPLPAMLPNGALGAHFMPAMDTYERNGRLCISMDLPGMHRDDVDVEVRGDRLTISGSRQLEREGTDGIWYRHERSTGSFERSLRLPEAIDPDQVGAEFDEGVLTVTVPVPAREPARIAKVDIKANH